MRALTPIEYLSSAATHSYTTTGMKTHACSSFMVFLLLASRVDAECFRAEIDGPNYECKGGSIEDMDDIPDDIKFIWIDRMSVGHVTRSTFSRFAGNLVGLKCVYCQIIDIDDNAFNGFTDLEHLNLSKNNLTKVKTSWFKSTVHLKNLYLSGNKIEDIEVHAFSKLTHLRLLALQENSLTELKVDWFRDSTVTLRYFLLSYNKIDDIENNTFSRFTELEELEIGDNNLGKVKAQWFGDSIPVKKLHFRNNKIEYFDRELLRKATSLTLLDLFQNKLTCSDIKDIVTQSHRKSMLIDAKNNYCSNCMMPELEMLTDGKTILYLD